MNNFSTIRWGILGPGNIARRFAEGVKSVNDARLTAVGSRDLAKANSFADQYDIPNRYGSYQELVADPEVDVIYVATPHNFHKEHSLLALNAGKPVLCEKPFTINAKEAEEVIATARVKNLFLMEGMWTRFFPLMYRVRELLREGAIGEPRMLTADFGFRAEINPEGRLFNPALGGGALLDVGVYPVSLSFMVFGTPDRITGMATMCETGVDEQAGMVFGYPNGEIALLSTSVRTTTPQEAVILGTEGRITIHPPWWQPRSMTLIRYGKPAEPIEVPFESTGFNYEATEVADCLRKGKRESDIMPLDETLAIMRAMDTLRTQWGLKYPME
jgi:predicted dehydrogenase